jgi:hypothetical protein
MRSSTGFQRRLLCLALGCVLAVNIPCSHAEQGKLIEIENRYVKWVVGEDGAIAAFIDKQSGADYALHQEGARFARVAKAGKVYASTQVALADGKLSIRFGESGITAVLGVATRERYFTLETLSISDEAVTELVFVDVPLKCQGTLADAFQCCALALSLKTGIDAIPGPSQHLAAACYGRPGLIGARAAIVGCPRDEFRNVLKEVVREARDLPQTTLGGPWAFEAEGNRGSYLIDYPGSISEKNVDKWIAVTKGLGARQIDFHTGHTLRFGDYAPDPTIYPHGLESLKAVIDKLHATGIAAGLHTYAFFLAKDSKWVSPVPDKRLGKDATFTLAAALNETNKAVPVEETTKDVSTLTGFQVRNSVTVQIDDELITYSGVNKEPPFAFTGCERGVCGTKAARHAKGARVHHLKECFGLFTPDGDSRLFDEVVARTAEVYNSCGFDMIYLDALDGADVLGSWPNGPRYYHTRFVYELCRALKKPAIMEMSTFDHALWFARSRAGAWDAPSKGYKRLIDRHFFENQGSQQHFMPANLGWWCVFNWTPKDRIRTFPDDLEYLMCKAIAGDHSLSWLMGFEPETYEKFDNCRRLAAMVKQYEDLRLSNYFPMSVRDKLAAPGSDFTLEKTPEGRWQFRPVQYDTHKVLALDGSSNCWKCKNSYSRQPLKVRIEALLSLAPYDGNGEVVAAFRAPGEFNLKQSSDGVSGALEPVTTPVKAASVSGCLTAQSEKTNRRCAWWMADKTFPQPVDLLERGFGVWVHGDGKGEVLNFQWRAPEHLSSGLSEHYAIIDFAGWRYFEFVEPESDRLLDYGWPYFYANPDNEFGGVEGVQRWNIYTGTCWVDYGRLDSLKLWYNDLPKGEKVQCYLSPIKSLPHVKARLKNPAIEVGGRLITFPVELESGRYLEFHSARDCKVYDANGALVREVTPLGAVPELAAGENTVKFNCQVNDGLNARANVTIISQAEQAIGRP